MMEVRPRVASGVLLHVPLEEGYFTIYIRRGEVRALAGNLIISPTGASPKDVCLQGVACFQVVVLVNDGDREFFTKVSPRQGLCAGNWHRITGEHQSFI